MLLFFSPFVWVLAGLHITHLEIHGRVGIITHAILDKYDFDFSTQNHEYLMYEYVICNLIIPHPL